MTSWFESFCARESEENGEAECVDEGFTGSRVIRCGQDIHVSMGCSCPSVDWKQRNKGAPVVCDGSVWERTKRGHFKAYC